MPKPHKMTVPLSVAERDQVRKVAEALNRNQADAVRELVRRAAAQLDAQVPLLLGQNGPRIEG